MRESNDLDHPVRAYAIDDDMPGSANALFLGNQTAPNAEWVDPDPAAVFTSWEPGRSGTAANAAKTDRINKSLRSAASKPIAQSPVGSPASLARRRALAAWWSASLSSGVATSV